MNEQKNLPGLLAAVTILLAGASWCTAEDAQKSTQPVPPVLKNLRWQYLDRKYQDVFIDGSGRAWFLIREFPSSTGGKRPAMFLTCPEAPDDYIEMPGENRLIGFDSKNRFWEVGKYGLCCTDVRTGKFEQRKPAPDVDLSRWPGNWGTWKPGFGPTMLEHSTGRLYFVDSVGIHMLDGDRWSYELLLPPGKNWVGAESDYCSVKMVEGPDGKVFVWHPGNYLNTLFMHDGTSWKQFPAKDYPELGLADNIVPEADGWVGVTHEFGPPSRVKLYDAQATTKAVATATRPSVKRFEANILANAGEELSLHGRALGRDRDGRVYYAATDQEIFYNSQRIAVMDARQAVTEPTLKYQAFGLHRAFDYRAVVVDSQGGIWARLAVEEHPFLSRYFDGKWTHYPDPAPAPADRAKGTLTQYGARWVIKPPSAGQDWQPDWKNDLRGVPSMANPALLQALKNGYMIASEDAEQRAFVFDAEGWHTYESLKELIEKRYDWLKEYMDNRSMSWRRDVFVGLDSAGRVWVSSSNKNGLSGAYDGTKWQDLSKGPFAFNAAGDRCLRRGFLLDSSVWPAKELISTKSGNHAYALLETQLRTDGRDRQVTTDPFAVESYAPAATSKPAGLPTKVKATDEGQVSWSWHSPLEKKPFYSLYAVWPDGKRSTPYQHSFKVNYQIVHQGGDIYWAFAGDGLLRLRLDGKGDQSRVMLDTHYPRIILQGQVLWMGIGADGALWVATYAGKSGLYRIEIPPVTEGKQ